MFVANNNLLINRILLVIVMVQVKGVEPIHPEALDPKSSASANSATPAYIITILVAYRGIEPRTP